MRTGCRPRPHRVTGNASDLARTVRCEPAPRCARNPPTLHLLSGFSRYPWARTMPSITDSIGRVLGGRYRLVTALGTGASAHVYLADDVTLHRRVAIKAASPARAGCSTLMATRR